jgi:hypothetical protein
MVEQKCKNNITEEATNEILLRVTEVGLKRSFGAMNYRRLLLADALRVPSTNSNSDNGSPLDDASFLTWTRRSSFFPIRPTSMTT